VSLSKDGRTLVLVHVAVLEVLMKEVRRVSGDQSDGEDHHVGQRTAIAKLLFSLPSLPPLCGVLYQTSSVRFYLHPHEPTRSQDFNNTAYLQLMAHRCAGARGRRAGPRMTPI
jgi:hypothetical protein